MPILIEIEEKLRVIIDHTQQELDAIRLLIKNYDCEYKEQETNKPIAQQEINRGEKVLKLIEKGDIKIA